MTKTRALATILATSALTAAMILPLAWPRTTLADGTDDSLRQDGTKIQHVVVSGTLERDDATKLWSMVVVAENDGDEEETAQIEADLTRVRMRMGVRVPPRPTAVLRRFETIAIPAGGKVERRYPLAKNVGDQIQRAANESERLYAQATWDSLVTSYDCKIKHKGEEFDWEKDGGWASGKYGDSMGAPVPPLRQVAQTGDVAF
jgi:hypothetical protein